MNAPIFTICSCNFLPQARTLLNSIQTTEATSNFVIFVVDGRRDYITSDALGCRVIYADDIGIPNYDYMKFIYSIAELNTAVKPYCFRFLFAAMGHKSAVYLDPDIVLLRPLEHVERALADGADLVLTPHITAPIEDDCRPSELDLMRAGIYNLGFIAMRNTAETHEFLEWWGKRLQRDCIFDIAAGYHVDQKFLDLAPGFVEKTQILRHPGYNLAYWNIAQRRVTKCNDQLLVDGVPVHFIHFSGVDFSNPRNFSRHQNRLTWADLGALKDVYKNYLRSVSRNALLEGRNLSQEEYAYGKFLDGRQIPQILRRTCRHFTSPHPGSFESLFTLNTDFFNARAPVWPEYPGLKITRVYDCLWRSRADLQFSYNLYDIRGQCGFLAWCQIFLAREIPRELIMEIPRELLETCDMVGKFPFPVTAETIAKIFQPRFVAKHFLHAIFHGKDRAATRLQRRLDRLVTAPDHSLAGSGRLKHGVALFGYFHAETGVGEAARRCANALSRADVAFTSHLLRVGPPLRENVEFNALASSWNSFNRALICANAINFVNLYKLVPEAALTGRQKIGYWNWELPMIPAAWAAAFWHVDTIWTPSTFSCEAIGAGTDKLVQVLPIAVPDQIIDKFSARRQLGLDPSDFIVLTIFDLNSHIARKNPIAAVRAFIDAFAMKKESRPRMVVKLHGTGGHGAEYRELLELSARANITIIDDVFDQSKIRLLQASADAFVSLHRAEGFGLNIAECMSLGKPVVVTAFSGNMDFTNDGNSYLVPWKMRRVAPHEYPQGAGQWWSEPDHDAAVSALRSVAQQASIAAQRGAQARSDILAYCSMAAVSEKLCGLLSESNPGKS